MNAKGFKLCWECGKKRERCRAAMVHDGGVIEWVCRRCWRELNYDQYLYEYRTATREAGESS